MGFLQAAKAVLWGGSLGAWALAGTGLALLSMAIVRRRWARRRDNPAGVLVTEPGQHTVRFASVGGAATAKAALLRLGTPLRIAPGSEPPRSGRRKAVPSALGAFLHGPPGCGKTLLAQALAGELNLPLYTISGVALGELRAGAGVARVHQLLTTAVRRAPCLVFIDDLDALTSPRADAAEPNLPGAAPTLQKLLSGLDSLARRAVRVVVLGATRHPERLDAALLRPDRLGRAIALTLPDERERADIIALLASAHPELADLDAGALAARTVGASGAELRVLLARLAEQVAARLRADPESPSEVLADDLERALSASSPPAAPG